MTDNHLQKIIDGPVYLLKGKDGMVYGNSQAMALEVKGLRAELLECIADLACAFVDRDEARASRNKWRDDYKNERARSAKLAEALDKIYSMECGEVLGEIACKALAEWDGVS